MSNSTSAHVNTSGSDKRDGTRGPRHASVVIGLVAGTVIGVGIGLWLAPLASTLRQWLDDSARELAAGASERLERAGARAAAAVDGLASTAQSVRDGVADSVAHGAIEVGRLATATKS